MKSTLRLPLGTTALALGLSLLAGPALAFNPQPEPPEAASIQRASEIQPPHRAKRAFMQSTVRRIVQARRGTAGSFNPQPEPPKPYMFGRKIR